MAKSITSKSAGLRLLLIIAILAVPMVLFGNGYVQHVQSDLRFLSREKLGSELTQIVLAQHLAKVQEIPKSSLTRIKELEQKLGIPEDENYERHFYNTVAKIEGHDHGADTIVGYIADVASSSNLILDAEVDSYHLAAALTVYLPTLLADADAVITQLNLRDSGSNARFQMAILLGHMQGAVEKLDEAGQRSKEGSTRSTDYRVIEASTEKIGQATVRFGNQFMFGMASGDSVVLRQQVRDIRAAAQMMVVPGYRLLNDLLEERIELKSSRLMFISAVGIASALIALGLAASMFAKTLKRLDEVETAHKLSDEMRAETERVNQEVAVLNVNLSQKLSELKAAQDELLNKGKMEQLGQLTATVAHEIRNPLGAVRTSAFLIGRKLQGKNTGIEPQLDRINNGISRCDAIITQLLDFSRTKEVQTNAAKLDEWLEKVLLEDSETLPASVLIECELGLGDAEVNFDGARLRRAVLNLVTNACEAMVGNGKDVSAGMVTKPTVRVSSRFAGGEVCIEIADNGPGMSADVLARIREPLFTTKNFGTGLGVPAVEQIAIQHGGRLDIESAPGVGSKFAICLPLVKSTERIAA